MNNSTNTPNSRQPLGLRILRGLAIVGLCLGLTLITVLAILGCLPALFTELEQLSASSNKVLRVALVITTIFSIFLPLIGIMFAEGRRWLTWSVIAGGWIVMLPVLVWLSWDEPALRRPITFEEFSPTVPGDEKSYELLMQYSKQTPSAEAKAFHQGKLYAMGWKNTASTREASEWVGFVTENRSALEADWAALAPQRRWLEELATFDRIGDLTPADASANVMTYQVWSILSHRTCAMATLLALDGQGDRAIDYLMPLLEVGRKLQLSSRMLSRSMIGIVVERMALETAGIVLEQARVSDANRARLGVAITYDDTSALARRMILVDYVQTLPKFTRMRLGEEVKSDHGVSRYLRRPLNWLGGLFVNPVATANLYGDHCYALADLAEQRKLVEFNECGKDFINMIWGRIGVKNIGGRLMLNLAIPSMNKALENHWKTGDIRTQLKRRLAQ